MSDRVVMIPQIKKDVVELEFVENMSSFSSTSSSSTSSSNTNSDQLCGTPLDKTWTLPKKIQEFLVPSSYCSTFEEQTGGETQNQ